MRKFSIQDFKEGKCAIKNDGTLEQLREVLKKVNCQNYNNIGGHCNYYIFRDNNLIFIDYFETLKGIPFQSVKDFLTEEKPLPRLVFVSDINDIKTAVQRVLFMEKNGEFLCWRNALTLEESEQSMSIKNWEYKWELDYIPEYTMEELSKIIGHDFKIKQ